MTSSVLKFGARFLGLEPYPSAEFRFIEIGRHVFLNDDEEKATGDSSKADEGYQDDINETEESRQKREEFVRSLFFSITLIIH